MDTKLRIKQAQCNLVLEFLQRRINARPEVGFGSRGKTSFGQEEESIYQKLLALNKRGI